MLVVKPDCVGFRMTGQGMLTDLGERRNQNKSILLKPLPG